MHGPSMSLYTAKDFIHPQFPQGYPHVHRAKTPHFPGFPRLYPHRPQVIHSRYPQRFPVWIFMWTFTISCFYLFAHMHICMFMRVRVCSRCFTCFIRALQTPNFPCPKQTNVTKTSNPQRLSAPPPSAHRKKPPAGGSGAHPAGAWGITRSLRRNRIRPGAPQTQRRRYPGWPALRRSKRRWQQRSARQWQRRTRRTGRPPASG